MIQQYLENIFKLGRLHNSWLVSSHDCKKALEEIQAFVKISLFNSDILLENHPDFMLITRSSENNAKNISIDQIREAQDFLSKTASVGNNKVIIIYQADLMTPNAANSCLKMLEDTPKNSYIFLLTNKAAAILPTIRSRTAKINDQRSFDNRTFTLEDNCTIEHQDSNQNSNVTSLLLTALANNSVNDRLNFIAEFSDKNRELWALVGQEALELIAKFAKKAANLDIELSEIEQRVFENLSSANSISLQERFSAIKSLVDDTISYDLDLRASAILLLGFTSNNIILVK